MSDAIRQIRARARRKAAGLVRLEFWVPATRRDEVRAAVQLILDSPPPSASEPAPVVHRRRRLMTDIDGLLD